MSDSSIIAQRIKEARQRAGLSQERLGQLAGIEESSASARINKYERSKHVPGFDTMKQIARVLHVPVAYFYAEDEREAQLLLGFYLLSDNQKDALIAFIGKMD